MKVAKKLFTIDLDVYEKAMADLNLYHDMLVTAHNEAEKAELEDEFVEELRMQADIIEEVLINLRKSVVNGANMDPGGDPMIH